MRTPTAMLVRQIGAGARRDGLSVRDMSAAGPLELTYVNPSREQSEGGADRPGEVGLAWLEPDPCRAREIVKRADPSPFRYFLDATQRTLPCFNIGAIPIVCGFLSAGILERYSNGTFQLMPGMHRFERIFVAPLHSGRAEIDRILSEIRADGSTVVDPLANVWDNDPGLYRESLHDFGKLMGLAYNRMGEERQRIETSLLQSWLDGPRDGTIVIDGPLRIETQDAIGLLKSFQRQYLSGAEAAALFDLKMNERSATFEIPGSFGRKSPVLAWYQRFWESTGKDPRHALVRVETSASAPAGSIDDLAGWLMAERAPRATADARWATLLYPIHVLEKILKQRLDAETRGWPGQ